MDDNIVVLASSGDRRKEELAVEQIEKLMKNTEDDSEEFYRLEELRASTKTGILKMEEFSHYNPMKENPALSYNQRRGWLLISYTMIRLANVRDQNPLARKYSKFIEWFGKRSLTLVNDIDPRIQKLSMEILTIVSQKMGYDFFKFLKAPLLEKMNRYLSSTKASNEKELSRTTDQKARSSTIAAISTSSKTTNEFALIQCFKSLYALAEVFKAGFVMEIDEIFLNVILSGLSHSNAGVREAAHGICFQVVNKGLIRELSYGLRLTYKIVEGLGDCSSQVRIAAALTIKDMLLYVGINERDAWYEAIIPPLCLSRYYATDTKFMLLCQNIWQERIKHKGPFYVARYMKQVVRCYTGSLRSTNPGVQQAAASSMSELACKIPKETISGYLLELLSAIEKAIHSKIWQTSDAAILTLGSYIMNHPKETRPYVEKLIPTLLQMLGSLNPQIRRGVSATLAKVASTYGKVYVDQIFNYILISLRNMYVQGEQSTSGKTVDESVVVGKIHSSSEETVDEKVEGVKKEPTSEDTVDETVGKLSEISPKPDATAEFVKKVSLSWAKADGSLYLIGDLCSMKNCKDLLPSLLPDIFKALETKCYEDHVVLMETACKIIPLLLNGLDKSVFKEHINKFFDIIFYVIELKDTSPSYARMCLDEMGKKLGPGILRGRVELYNPRYVIHCDPGAI